LSQANYAPLTIFVDKSPPNSILAADEFYHIRSFTMKKVTFLLICVLALPLFGQASHEELASRFFKLNTPEALVQSNLLEQLDQMAPYLSGGLKAEADSQEGISEMDSIKEVIGLFMADFSYEELERISIPIIVSQYSAVELEALTGFLESPAGQAYLRYSSPSSSYLAQAMKIYFDRKAEDQEWVMGILLSLLAKFGLGDSEEGDATGQLFDWSWDEPDEPDTVRADYWDEQAYPDTLSYNYEEPEETWEDYWGGPVPTSISISALSFDTLDQYLFVFNNILPIFKQISEQLTAYYDEYGGYPNELDWSQIKTVKGFDLEYLHDSVLLKAISNQSFDLPGVEIIYYIQDDSIWMSVPKKR